MITDLDSAHIKVGAWAASKAVYLTRLGTVLTLLFFYLYHPPVAGIQSMHVLFIIGVAYVAVGGIKAVSNRTVALALILCGLGGYLAFAQATAGAPIFLSLSHLQLWAQSSVVAVVIVDLILRWKLSLSSTLILAGVLQALISILAFMIPSFQDAILAEFITYGFNAQTIEVWSDTRMFGFSYNLNYTLPAAQALIALFVVYLSITRHWSYVFALPFILFSAIVNARLSLVIFMIGLLGIAAQLTFSRTRYRGRLTFILVTLGLVVFLGIGFMRNTAPETLAWLEHGVFDLMASVGLREEGVKYSFVEYATSASNYTLPEGLDLLLGTGQMVMFENSPARTDIGVINDVWLGGFIYLTLLIVAIVSISVLATPRLRRYIRYAGFYTGLLLLLLTLLYIKGRVFSFNEVTNLLLLCTVYLWHADYRNGARKAPVAQGRHPEKY